MHNVGTHRIARHLDERSVLMLSIDPQSDIGAIIDTLLTGAIVIRSPTLDDEQTGTRPKRTRPRHAQDYPSRVIAYSSVLSAPPSRRARPRWSRRARRQCARSAARAASGKSVIQLSTTTVSVPPPALVPIITNYRPSQPMSSLRCGISDASTWNLNSLAVNRSLGSRRRSVLHTSTRGPRSRLPLTD